MTAALASTPAHGSFQLVCDHLTDVRSPLVYQYLAGTTVADGMQWLAPNSPAEIEAFAPVLELLDRT